jgi:hypothetical protein
MEDNILMPKYRKGKKPVKVRKPSRPLDGINHRLMAEQITQVLESVTREASAVPEEDAPPSREELETKATELGIKFDKRTTDKRLLDKITEALKES